jgi:dUTP pyrophosphatase
VKIGVKFKRLPNGVDLALPSYADDGAAGMDILAAEDVFVPNRGGVRLIRCGFAMAIPSGYEVQIRPRSGLAKNHGVSVLNAPGTVDSSYRGEVCVLLINHGVADFISPRGTRIAQMVFAPVAQAVLLPVAELDETVRASGGFGSTGCA